MLTTDRETAICEKYSAYDKNNRVHCDECPLRKGDPTQYDFRCKANSHYNRRITMKIRLNNSADATTVVSIANKFKDCDIDGKFGRYIIDLKSILGVLSFELPKTIEVVIQSDNTKLIEDLEHQLGFWKVEDDDRII